MKHKKLTVVASLIMLITISCDNSSTILDNESNSRFETKTISTFHQENDSLGLTYSSTLTLIDSFYLTEPQKNLFFCNDEFINMSFNNSFKSTREEHITPLTYTGYQEMGEIEKDAVKNASFSKAICDPIGLSHLNTYSCYVYQAALRVGIPSSNTWVNLPSPQCGFTPGRTDNRGYFSYKVDGVSSYVMYTNLYLASSYDLGPLDNKVWVPCKPEEIVWNFGMK